MEVSPCFTRITSKGYRCVYRLISSKYAKVIICIEKLLSTMSLCHRIGKHISNNFLKYESLVYYANILWHTFGLSFDHVRDNDSTLSQLTVCLHFIKFRVLSN